MKYQFIISNRFEFPVLKMCRVLKVSKSGYYDWLGRPKSKTEQRREMLMKKLIELNEKNYGVYGSPRMREALNKQGIKVSKNTVAKLMQIQQIKAIPKRRYVHTTDSKHGYVVALNLLNRDFTASGPNQKWVSDITYLMVDGRWMYLCVIIDLYSRRVVGWSFDDHMKASLLIQAFLMAVSMRRPGKGLVFHSDRGVQYACKEFRDYLGRYKMIQSMSRKGNCWDNSCAESFFKTIKTEFLNQRYFSNMHTARMAIFEYIETFYNTRRIHSTIGNCSPMEYEEKLVA